MQIKNNVVYLYKNINKMSKITVGNKQNSVLNGEWAGHVRRAWKKLTQKLRRNESKKIQRADIRELLNDKNI